MKTSVELTNTEKGTIFKKKKNRILFSSFEMSHENILKSTKERWKIALHDPAYLIIWGGLIIFIILIIAI